MASPQSAALLAKLDGRAAVVGVIGLGYIGLPFAVAAAQRGFPVIGFDIDARKVERLLAFDSYVEAISETALRDAAAAGGLDWTADFARIAECDVVIVCVPTPLGKHNEPDLSFVVGTARSISEHLTQGTLVVLESTTFPGTTEDIFMPILDESGLIGEVDVFVAYSPERADPGNDRFTTENTPKVVAGAGPAALELATAFYGAVVDKVVPVSSTRAAEAVKITENIFRAVNIALVNELKVIYDAMDVDIWEVIDAAATKPFGFMPFYPGPGLGGHCIPIDPFYLSWKAREHDLTARFVELAGEINVQMPNYVVQRLRETLDKAKGRGLNGAKVLLVGVAYKKNVSDMRESPSVRLMQLMLEAGAMVDFLDPHVPEIPQMRAYPGLLGRTSVAPARVRAGDYDAILIATDHDAIDYAALTRLGAPIVDTRNAIASRNLAMEHVVKA